jgi:hypothetical protein
MPNPDIFGGVQVFVLDPDIVAAPLNFWSDGLEDVPVV